LSSLVLRELAQNRLNISTRNYFKDTSPAPAESVVSLLIRIWKSVLLEIPVRIESIWIREIFRISMNCPGHEQIFIIDINTISFPAPKCSWE